MRALSVCVQPEDVPREAILLAARTEADEGLRGDELWGTISLYLSREGGQRHSYFLYA